VSEVVNRVKPP